MAEQQQMAGQRRMVVQQMAEHLQEAQRLRMVLHQRTHQTEMRNQGQTHKGQMVPAVEAVQTVEALRQAAGKARRRSERTQPHF
jgi:hypothetical protein